VPWSVSLIVGAGEIFAIVPKLPFFRLFPALSQALMISGQKKKMPENRSPGPVEENAGILEKGID
jgi:hypothetical protein